jgi:hypothetical protein
MSDLALRPSPRRVGRSVVAAGGGLLAMRGRAT